MIQLPQDEQKLRNWINDTIAHYRDSLPEMGMLIRIEAYPKGVVCIANQQIIGLPDAIEETGIRNADITPESLRRGCDEVIARATRQAKGIN